MQTQMQYFAFFIFSLYFYRKKMINIHQILAIKDIGEKITRLKERSTEAPEWEKLQLEYYPKLHSIKTDHQKRKDKIHSDGSKDEAARLTVGLERLLCRRMSEFTFSIPVKRSYETADENGKEIARAIERIYKVAHIDTENLRRSLAYYASCEIFTIWYVKPENHSLYGFPCKYKLKCKTLSPMDGTRLYPLIDERGEMHSMSYEYTKKVKDVQVTYFETFASDRHYVWKKEEKGEWEDVSQVDAIVLNKIPGIYLYRPEPVWEDLTCLREDVEYTLSRNSDTVAYNSAPILKVAGTLIGDENKGESRRVYRVSEGGDVNYVSWSQSNEALNGHINSLLNLFFMQAQMPDISFSNMKSLGNIGYDARKTLLADAHLKIGDESGAWLEFLERECSIVKTFLKSLNVKYENLVDDVYVQHTITPFNIIDEAEIIKMHKDANGGQPVESQRESIERIGLSQNVDATIAQIKEDQIIMAAVSNTGTEQEHT